jgi:hypothetical protein
LRIKTLGCDIQTGVRRGGPYGNEHSQASIHQNGTYFTRCAAALRRALSSELERKVVVGQGWISSEPASVAVMEDDVSAETSVVGNDGLIGVALILGGEPTPTRAHVRSAGEMQLVLLRCTQTLTQMAQTAKSPIFLD